MLRERSIWWVIIVKFNVISGGKIESGEEVKLIKFMIFLN